MTKAKYGPTILRLFLAILFIIPGFSKLFGMLGAGHPIVELLGSLWTWVLIVVEIGIGIVLLLGWKVRYTIWPLVVILVVALIMVTIPSKNPVNILFHLLGIAALVSIALTGAGALAIDRH